MQTNDSPADAQAREQRRAGWLEVGGCKNAERSNNTGRWIWRCSP